MDCIINLKIIIVSNNGTIVYVHMYVGSICFMHALKTRMKSIVMINIQGTCSIGFTIVILREDEVQCTRSMTKMTSGCN